MFYSWQYAVQTPTIFADCSTNSTDMSSSLAGVHQ